MGSGIAAFSDNARAQATSQAATGELCASFQQLVQ
jgi:hypothetical protein